MKVNKGPYSQWDFQGPPIMGVPYGKLPIFFPNQALIPLPIQNP